MDLKTASSTICVSRRTAAFQFKLAELDGLTVNKIAVRTGARRFGNHTKTRRECTFQHSSSGHVIGMHVRIDCTSISAIQSNETVSN